MALVWNGMCSLQFKPANSLHVCMRHVVVCICNICSHGCNIVYDQACKLMVGIKVDWLKRFDNKFGLNQLACVTQTRAG